MFSSGRPVLLPAVRWTARRRGPLNFLALRRRSVIINCECDSLVDPGNMLQTLFNYGHADVSTCWCSRCGNRLPCADINVTADSALCRQCGAAHRFSELAQNGGFPVFDLSRPPQGTSFQAAIEGFVVCATTRSPEAWSLIPFLLVWSGFSLGGIYGSQFQKGEFDLAASLFGIPFVLGTFSLAAIKRYRGFVVRSMNTVSGGCPCRLALGNLYYPWPSP